SGALQPSSALAKERDDPPALLAALFGQCLREMGGGQAAFDLSFAWEAEKALAAVLMRALYVGGAAASGPGAGTASPSHKQPHGGPYGGPHGGPGGSSGAGGGGSGAAPPPQSLLSLCMRWSQSLSLHVLLNKVREKNLRALVQVDCPVW